MKILLLVTLFNLGLLTHSMAASPTLQNLTASDVQGALNDFATATFPSHVTSAGSYGKIFGFEVGLLGGVADSPTINRLAPNEKVDQLPKAAFLASATGPFGLGAELALLPVKVGDFEYDYFSFGVRWTFTDLFNILPLDVKLRAQFTNADISFKQNISSVPVTVKYSGKTTAYSLTVGKRILIVEPYAGFGIIDGDHDLTSTGSTTIFDNSVTLSQREKVSIDDSYYFAGVDLHLLILTLGAEYTKVYGNSIMMGKLAFGF